MLDVLEEALDQNSVRYLRLKSGSKYERTLKAFKVRFFLLHLIILFLLLKIELFNFLSLSCTNSGN